ncbi:putative Histidine kinase [Candidatus Hydrogenisulfobacillus filiaventi]|uniref:histidine kinase n=1 Tax=Candidatus Hydrogenisulfobacillus filiaventi TaxID=2707344 RepID=A0A6F8ZIP0_9FIRM|nr:putative Histidine kinase [Candidatus Hydrogenisulfobacillus filiaventi]
MNRLLMRRPGRAAAWIAAGAGLAGLLVLSWTAGRGAAGLALALLAAAGGVLALRPAPAPLPEPADVAATAEAGALMPDTLLRPTSSFFRQGLTADTAQVLAAVIHRMVPVDAVAVADTHVPLAWSGRTCPAHGLECPVHLAVGSLREEDQAGPGEVRTHTIGVGPDHQVPCPLRTALVAPLYAHGRVIGALRFYNPVERPFSPHIVRLAEGLGQLLSHMLELAEENRQQRIASEARLEALQAQIRPHFLFNVLNTIILFSRTDPERSRELLGQLATFFRRSLSHRGPTIALKDEIDHVQTYLTLEKARFGDKLRYRIRLDPAVLNLPVPVLVLQPLVENAVVHGLAPKETPGMVSVTARLVRGTIQIFVTDNGVGIPPDRQQAVFTMGVGEGTGTGVGLSNVAERLVGLYGPAYALTLKSIPGRGTSVRVRIPAAAGHGPAPAEEGR